MFMTVSLFKISGKSETSKDNSSIFKNNSFDIWSNGSGIIIVEFLFIVLACRLECLQIINFSQLYFVNKVIRGYSIVGDNTFLSKNRYVSDVFGMLVPEVACNEKKSSI